MSKVLLDECIPRPLGQYLEGHYVRTVPQMGWASVSNGPLIKLAEAEFEVFITVDKGIRYQQKLRRFWAFLFCAREAIALKTYCP